MHTIEYPIWVWAVFFAVVITALIVDIGIVNRKAHAPTRKETIGWSIVWVSLALIFNGFVYWVVGRQFNDWTLALAQAKLFLTGYLIELSLSVDNLFVFLLIFTFFKVPKKYQHRVLFWGIMGALGLRMIMIFAGAELVERFHWVIYIFGAFLYDGDKFFVVTDGVRSGTLLLLVLITVEFTDLVFAVDSIPAIFGITTDRFIVYTSNIFAILGLRTFFFLLADMAEKFHYLKYGLAFILSFIGIKMLLPLAASGLIMATGDGSSSAFGGILDRYLKHEFDQLVINISLGVVVAAILISVIISMLIAPKHKTENDENE